VVDALHAAGVTKPVRLMPHPVALGQSPGIADRAAFSIPADAFAVLALGDLHSSASRKNLVGAIEVFVRAFPAEGEARLIVKVREEGAYPAFLAEARQRASGRNDIGFVTGDLSASDMRRLIASSSLVLSPHRSEGFGLPLAEALLAGVPALATGWSGNMDFMAAMPELLIASSLVPVNDRYGVYRGPGQVWAEPDVEDAAAKLRRLAASVELRHRLAAEGKAAIEALNLPWAREALLETSLGKLAVAP
jgi:glycosyltransferase involved in cell wall biosynthesis